MNCVKLPILVLLSAQSLRTAFVSLLLLLAIAPISSAAPRTVETDLLIVGATESGWAAAIQAARSGVQSVMIIHDGEWFGGQYTEQALACVDENKGVGSNILPSPQENTDSRS